MAGDGYETELSFYRQRLAPDVGCTLRCMPKNMRLFLQSNKLSSSLGRPRLICPRKKDATMKDSRYYCSSHGFQPASPTNKILPPLHLLSLVTRQSMSSRMTLRTPHRLPKQSTREGHGNMFVIHCVCTFSRRVPHRWFHRRGRSARPTGLARCPVRMDGTRKHPARNFRDANRRSTPGRQATCYTAGRCNDLEKKAGQKQSVGKLCQV